MNHGCHCKPHFNDENACNKCGCSIKECSCGCKKDSCSCGDKCTCSK